MTLTGVELGEGERFSLPFSESWKKRTDFWKKPWLCPSIQILVLTVSWIKKLRNVSLHACLFLTKCQNMSLNNCSSTCRVILCNVLYKRYSELWHTHNPVYYSKFRHTQAYSCPTQTYSAILCHIQNPETKLHACSNI